jgi:uncharacterized protein (TIRG00374 family)
MKVRRALIGFATITVFYLVALILVDYRNQVFAEFPKLLSVLPTLMGFSLLSYLVRYLRWYWLLSRAGNKTSVVYGYLAYLAGFAFTATPGKVGELMRIRYFAPQGVPPWRVLAAFVYERAFDLMAVLLLSALAISRKDLFVFALGFVLILLAGFIFAALNPAWLTRASAYLRFHRLKKLARICMILRDGLSGCLLWVTPLDVLVSMVLGVLAWSLTSFSFVWLLNHLGVSIPSLSALAIYPLAMLAGAASMLPGGVGSTEVAIVALLSFFDVPLGIATLAAVGIRFSSIWFAVLCGFLALSALELRFCRTEVAPRIKTRA